MTDTVKYAYLTLMGTIQALDDHSPIDEDEAAKIARDFHALLALHKVKLLGRLEGVRNPSTGCVIRQTEAVPNG